MRCQKCGHLYEPGAAQTNACPRCGHVPRAAQGRRPARSLQQRLDGGIALAVFVGGFLVLPILTLLTGQLLLGGGLILLMLGGYTLLYSARGNLRNLAHPRQTAVVGYVFGVLMLAGAIGCLAWYALSGPAWPSLAGLRRLFASDWQSWLTSLLPLAVVAIFAALGALLDHLWSRQNAAQREADGQAGPVFPIPPTYRATSITVILLSGRTAGGRSWP